MLTEGDFSTCLQLPDAFPAHNRQK